MKNIKYYGPKYLINTLESLYYKDFNSIKDEINTYKILLTKEEIQEYLIKNKKKFDEEIFKYFIEYTNILKKKILLLLDIVEKIANEDTTEIKNILNELDIKITSKGRISSVDIKRLINPLTYNISKLKKLVSISNNIDTYLILYKSKNNIISGNINLQVKDITENENGYVPLTKNQIAKLKMKSNVKKYTIK